MAKKKLTTGQHMAKNLAWAYAGVAWGIGWTWYSLTAAARNGELWWLYLVLAALFVGFTVFEIFMARAAWRRLLRAEVMTSGEHFLKVMGRGKL